MKKFSVEESTFKTAALFVLDCSFAELSKHMRDEFSQICGDDIGQVGQMMTYDAPPYRVVWTKSLNILHVLHEIFHLVTRICYDKGIEVVAMNSHGDPNDEPAAYLFEFYVSQVLDKRIKWRRHSGPSCEGKH